jgi:hypothetical protein
MLIAANAEPPIWKPVEAAMKQTIKSAVGRKLIDSVSAVYKWPNENINGAAYCGWVNSKNGFGAYTGFRPFMVIVTHANGPKGHGQFLLFSADIADSTDEINTPPIYNMCSQQGLDLSGPPSDDRNDLSH